MAAMIATAARDIPEVRGWPWLGVTFDLLHRPLALLERVGSLPGGIGRFVYWRGSRVLLNDPEAIEQVLIVQHERFVKGELLQLAARRLLGDGLLTSEGELWRRQRRLMQPAFQRARVAALAPVMVAAAEELAAAWQAGGVRDVAADFMQLSLHIALRALFGMELDGHAVAIGEALGAIMRRDLRRIRAPVRLPRWVPTPANRRAEAGYDLLEQIVNEILERKQRQPGGSDLLTQLLESTDLDGGRMSPRQLRDETMTLLLAGHETTALALSWTCYLLARYPAAAARLQEELDGTLGDRWPAVEDLERLRYLAAVVQESLRLFPPAYALGRSSKVPVEIVGHRFPAGTIFLMSPWVTQRDARFFERPLEFWPERWLRGRLPASLTYFPFGAGPRRCIGEVFARQECALVLAVLLRRFRLRLFEGQRVEPEPLVTLRPWGGLLLQIERAS
jgi:cytochrome P450